MNDKCEIVFLYFKMKEVEFASFLGGMDAKEARERERRFKEQKIPLTNRHAVCKMV